MRTEVNTIVFSKNRACQLEVLLRGMNMPATVVWHADDGFLAGYEKLIPMYPGTKFVKQVVFKDQIVESIVGDYTMFECDDDIALEPFDENCPEFQLFKARPDIICLSLRLCPHYAGAPVMQGNTWEWKGLRHSWGYPMSVTSHIFRTADILPTILATELQIPNSIEVAIRRHPPERPLMYCFDKPKFVNNLANQVQTKYVDDNHAHITVEFLEEKFMGGERISLEDMRDKATRATGPFMKEQYKWEKV